MDRDSIYRCEGVASIAEQLAGKEPQTQFGRAMEQLGVELILAYSPQAKGRLERMNGVLQDRLVKAMRLAGISELESANRFLDGGYLRQFNRQFARAAASPLDMHRGVPRSLKEVLSWEEVRVVQSDWTAACAGKRYQLDPQHEALSLVVLFSYFAPPTARTRRDGLVHPRSVRLSVALGGDDYAFILSALRPAAPTALHSKYGAQSRASRARESLRLDCGSLGSASISCSPRHPSVLQIDPPPGSGEIAVRILRTK